MTAIQLPNAFTPRPYQRDAMAHFDNGGKRGVYCWPRRSGKDLTFVHQAVKAAHMRVGTYFHMLPNHKQARKVIWDAIDNDGRRIVDTAIPLALRESTNETEMKVKLKCGSLWQLVGADYYDSVLGSNPVGLVMSEAALTNPVAWNFFRPILAANDGWAAFISTPRGYNWFYQLLETAKGAQGFHWSHLTVRDTGHISEAVLREERSQMPEELYRQEYDCDFSAANVGAILGRYVEAADREGRISMDVRYDPSQPVHISCDIGYRDAAAFFFWQAYTDGFALVDYYEDTGLDASDWIERLAMLPYSVETLWLPHDARAKTFATKHSVVQQFIDAKQSGKYPVKSIKLVPQASLQDRINAGRTVLPRCRFDAAACAQGLAALREWSFKYDEERRNYSAEPDHNWASHGADAFTYGALMMREQVKAAPRVQPQYATPMTYSFSLEQLWADREKMRRGNTRIEL